MWQFSMEIVAAAEEADEVGHVNNSVYLRYVEQVSRAHPESVGLDYAGFLALGGYFVVRKHVIEYHRPAFPGDRLSLLTRVRAQGGVRAVREVRIERAGEVVAEAETEWVWVDARTGRPKRIPDEVPRRLPSYV